MNRIEQLSRLKAHLGKTWDVIVIGGGATGLGIAVDAVTRGYEKNVLEMKDLLALAKQTV